MYFLKLLRKLKAMVLVQILVEFLAPGKPLAVFLGW